MSELYITWNVSPEAFSIGSFTIRWYGILYACSFLACYPAFRELSKYDKLPEYFCELVLLYIILGTIIGARLGDCFFYHPQYYWQNPLEIFSIRQGGLSSHGGAIGILIGLYLFSRKIKKPYIWVLDYLVIVIGIAASFIRLGNLMNSEIYGYATTLPWGFIFERRFETIPKHPTQIYEALHYAMTYVILRFVYRRCNNRPRPFLIFGLFLIIVFVFRFCIEFIKPAQSHSVLEEKLISIFGLNMGQLLSVPFILLGVISLIVSSRQKRIENLRVII